MYSELTRGYLLEQDEAKYTERRKRVYNVFKIPIELEKVVFGYGKLHFIKVCLFLFSSFSLFSTDIFNAGMHFYTFLRFCRCDVALRFLVSSRQPLNTGNFRNSYLILSECNCTIVIIIIFYRVYRRGRVLEPAQRCDILKVVILICCYFLMQTVDLSMIYHIIRGQAIIKLYIFFNMLEV